MAVNKWVANVHTVSTYPEEHLFTKDAQTIAEHLASKKVSPKGPASGMRMLNYYINRAGKNLSEERHAELERAKGILSGIIAKQKAKAAPKKAASNNAASKKTASKKTAATKTSEKKAAAKKVAKKSSAKSVARKSAESK